MINADTQWALADGVYATEKHPHPQPFPHFVEEGSKEKVDFVPPPHVMGRGLGGGVNSLFYGWGSKWRK